ncbi:MAG: type II restriction endonuclease [Candidatus Bathyarchaeia archaeon]
MSEVVEEVIKTIPELEIILKEAVKTLKLDKETPEKITENFERLIRDVETTAFTIYREHELKAFNELKDLWFNQKKDWIKKVIEEKGFEGVKEVLSTFIEPVRELEFRASQMRKARGGKTFEHLIKILLNLAGVPCEEPHEKTRNVLKRIDLVSPDAETARLTPDKAIFISTKRTLRERWKQVVPEHMKGARLYLITINNDITEEKAREIKETGMVIYVRNNLKEKPHLKNKPWVRKLSDLPKDIRNTVPKPKQQKL